MNIATIICNNFNAKYIDSIEGVMTINHCFFCDFYEFCKIKRRKKDIEDAAECTIEIKFYNGNLKIKEQKKENMNILLNNVWKHCQELGTTSICAGVDDIADHVDIDFDKSPHLLVAGQSGSGKSVFLNNLIVQLLYKEVVLVLLDAKNGVELGKYGKNVCDTKEKCLNALKWACREMDKRYKKMKRKKAVTYHGIFKKCFVIIDELAELMLWNKKEVEPLLIRIAQLGRACGISLVLATQRPTVNVVTGLIKANIDTRLCLSVASKRDSMNILDNGYGYLLKGKGHALLKYGDSTKLVELQTPYISNDEIIRILK